MRRLLIALALLVPPLIGVAQTQESGIPAPETHERVVNRDAWPPEAHSDILLKIPALRDMLALFDERPEVRLVIRHPGEAFGRPWAEGLQRWLVANGIPLDHIRLQAGAKRADQLQLLLEGL